MPAPTIYQDPGCGQGVEDLAVEQLVPEFSIDALVLAALPWAARFGEQCLRAYPRQPFTHRNSGEFTAIVGTDVIRCAMPNEQICQHMQNIVMPQAPHSLDRQASVWQITPILTLRRPNLGFPMISSGVYRFRPTSSSLQDQIGQTLSIILDQFSGGRSV